MKFSRQDGKRMAVSAPAKEKSKTSIRLADLRLKTACRVHKSIGDADEIRKDGLTVHKALENVRHRANKTAHDK